MSRTPAKSRTAPSIWTAASDLAMLFTIGLATMVVGMAPIGWRMLAGADGQMTRND